MGLGDRRAELLGVESWRGYSPGPRGPVSRLLLPCLGGTLGTASFACSPPTGGAGPRRLYDSRGHMWYRLRGRSFVCWLLFCCILGIGSRRSLKEGHEWVAEIGLGGLGSARLGLVVRVWWERRRRRRCRSATRRHGCRPAWRHRRGQALRTTPNVLAREVAPTPKPGASLVDPESATRAAERVLLHVSIADPTSVGWSGIAFDTGHLKQGCN